VESRGGDIDDPDGESGDVLVDVHNPDLRTVDLLSDIDDAELDAAQIAGHVHCRGLEPLRPWDELKIPAS
jgi:hypothetical protein